MENLHCLEAEVLIKHTSWFRYVSEDQELATQYVMLLQEGMMFVGHVLFDFIFICTSFYTS